jgi:hypothetical protein
VSIDIILKLKSLKNHQRHTGPHRRFAYLFIDYSKNKHEDALEQEHRLLDTFTHTVGFGPSRKNGYQADFSQLSSIYMHDINIYV